MKRVAEEQVIETVEVEAGKGEATKKASNKTRRVQNNVRGFSSTANDRHPFIEAYYTYVKGEPDELTTSILEGLFLSASGSSEMPAAFIDEGMASVVELVARLKATPSIGADAGLLPSAMFGTIDADVLLAMMMRNLKVAMAQAQGQQMADSDSSELACKKQAASVEFSIRTFLAQGGLHERHPTITDRALSALEMLRGVADQPQHHLPSIIDSALHSIRNRPALAAALRIDPPDARQLVHLTRVAFESYLIVYDHAKMRDAYRPCAMADACCFLRADRRTGTLLPVRDAPLVAWWRPGCRSHVDLTLAPLCILCYTLYLNILSLVHRLRAQDSYYAQVFEVEVGGADGFPPSYVHMPGMVQRGSHHNGYIGPFPNADAVLDNLVRVSDRGPFSIKQPPLALLPSLSSSLVKEENEKEKEKEEGRIALALPNFS